MKGLMFQKSQKIIEIQKINYQLQQQLKTVIQQFKFVESELNLLTQEQNKNQNQITIFEVDKQMLQRQIKGQNKQQERLTNEIKQMQTLFQKVQQTSLTKQQQLYQLTRKEEQLSQRVSRLKQQYKMYLTIGQSQSNIVNLASKLQRQKKTSEKMLEILLNKQKARIKYFNLLTAKRQKDQKADQKQNTNKDRVKEPFKVSMSPKGRSLQITKSDFALNKKSDHKQENAQIDNHKDKAKKYDEMIRKKNMILNKQ